MFNSELMMAKTKITLGTYQIILVPISEIKEQDPFTAQLLAAQQYETDVAVDFECWDVVVVEALAYRLLPILIRRRDGYHYLGSGYAVRLLQQIFEPHDKVPAIVLDAKRLSDKVKLDALACDLLLLPTFFRTRPLLPLRNMQLWEAIVDVGGTPIRGKGRHAFARATGFSPNALKAPQRGETASAKSDEIAPLPEFTTTEGEA